MAKQPIVTRFAPSPNGPLHLGHAYSAIIAHDLAKAAGGRFLLRIEDIDGERSKPELADQFREDLRWLGLEWEGVPAQSERTQSYDDAAQQVLRGKYDLLYPCNCTRAEIAEVATQLGPDGPVYPGTCRNKEFGLCDETVSWRIDMERAVAIAGPIEWVDELAGPQRATPEIFGDVVLLRKDVPASYHLAATLDDAADGVTLVTRGSDLFPATHIHRLLQDLLGLPVPKWHHHALVLDDEGCKLAKRRGSASLADLRKSGGDGLELSAELRAGRFGPVNSLSMV